MDKKFLYYLIKRVLLAIVTIFLVVTITFFTMQAIPGGPFLSEKSPSAETMAALEAKYGLDKSVGEQYLTYLKDVATLNFGPSIKVRGQQVMDLIFSGTLYINGVIGLAVTQNLLGIPGARLEDIKQAVSHPQALEQSAVYLRKHGITPVSYSNTALAAKHVAEIIYGLEVLAHGINESNMNTTRFATLSRVENKRTGRPDDNFMLLFTVKHEAGALAEAINIIGKYGYNMRGLHSRPMRELMWQYYFYMEAEGDVRSEKGEAMLAELAKVCDKLKLAGSYAVR